LGIDEFDLAALLRNLGISDDDLAEGIDAPKLIARVARPFLLPGTQLLGWNDIAERGGVSPEFVRRLWRAMGFPDPIDERPFNEADLEALGTAVHLVEEGLPPDVVLRQARVVGPSIGRIAELFVDELWHWRDEGMSDGEILSRLQAHFDVSRLERLFGYVLRRQLYSALLRRFGAPDAGDGGARSLAVGFVDLVGFTSLSQQFDEKQVADLAGQFEAVVFDAVVAGGGRFVKAAGDGAMFVADDPEVAVSVATDVLRCLRADDLPPARAGMSWGPVVSREGDYFGAVVNMASRIVAVAAPGTVVVSPALREAMGDAARAWPKAGVHELKGIGEVELYEARPPEDPLPFS